jgi:HK97 family phage major capsid protein
VPTLATLREDYARESFELHKIFEEAGAELDLARVKRVDGTPEEKAADIRRRNDLLADLQREIEGLEALGTIGQLNGLRQEKANTARAGDRPAYGGGTGPAPTDGALVLRQNGLLAFLHQDKGYRDLRDGRRRSVSIEIPVADFKTLITLSLASSQAARQPMVNMPLEERTVIDLLSAGTTDRTTIDYYEETTVTNAATTVAEGAAKPESALNWTLRTETVRKIATWIPATDEVLADVPWMESQIRNRLAYMVQRVEERQVLAGDGTGTNLLGLINRTGIQTQAKGADPTPDAIYKAMQKVRGASGTGFAEPTAYVTHPNDWTDVKLLRTTDGIYLWGNPSDEGPDRIWGKPVQQTTEITEGTGLVVSRPYAEVVRREGVTVTMSTEHSTFFTENKVAILAESRLALAVFRPSAFATVTGI